MIKIITNQIDHKNYLRPFYLLFTFEFNHRFIYRKETIKHQKDSDLTKQKHPKLYHSKKNRVAWY